MLKSHTYYNFYFYITNHQYKDIRKNVPVSNLRALDAAIPRKCESSKDLDRMVNVNALSECSYTVHHETRVVWHGDVYCNICGVEHTVIQRTRILFL